MEKNDQNSNLQLKCLNEVAGCCCGDTTAKAFSAKLVGFSKQPVVVLDINNFYNTLQVDSPMVMVEGIKMKSKRISKRQLNAAWKTLSSKPLPKIKALKLSDDDFNHVLQHRHCHEDSLREIEEWGRVLSIGGTDACVYNADEVDEADYVILVRENPYHTLDEIIVHELGHIARGDL